MKQPFINERVIAFIIIISITIISCYKQYPEGSKKNNEPFIIHSSSKVDIKASDIETNATYFKRKIEVIDRIRNIVHYTFIITVQSNQNTNDIYSELKQKTFEGSIIIESDNVELLRYNCSKASEISASTYAYSTQPLLKANAVPNTCKVSLVHGCVDQKIRKMNALSYALCLYGGPECYAGLWAECSWIFCLTGNQNVLEI
jgi:hypothetical protein